MDIGTTKARLLSRPGRRPNPGATADLRARPYYHGTQDPFAEHVLRTWTLEPRSATGLLPHKPRSWLDPMEGRVYLAQDPEHALRYLQLQRDRGPYPVGLLVEVDGRNLGEIYPDEDAVGQAAVIAGAGNYWEDDGVEQAVGETMWTRHAGDQFAHRTAFAERLLDLAQRHLTKHQLEHVMGEWGDPNVSMLAKIGKKLLPYMSDADQVELMELGVNVANLGPLPISRAFACPATFPIRTRLGGWDAMRQQCIEVFDADDYARARAMLLDDTMITSRA